MRGSRKALLFERGEQRRDRNDDRSENKLISGAIRRDCKSRDRTAYDVRKKPVSGMICVRRWFILTCLLRRKYSCANEFINLNIIAQLRGDGQPQTVHRNEGSYHSGQSLHGNIFSSSLRCCTAQSSVFPFLIKQLTDRTRPILNRSAMHILLTHAWHLSRVVIATLHACFGGRITVCR